MQVKLQRWGNSMGIRLPKSLLKECNLGPGAEFAIRKEKKRLVLEPVTKTTPMTLDDLLAGITPENRHEAVDWGAPVGREVW